MTEQIKEIADRPCEKSGDEIDLVYTISRVIWKRRKLIGGIVIATVFAVAIISLFQTDIYQAKAVIMPIGTKDSSGSAGLMVLAQQFGGVTGITTQGATSSFEIVGLLKSNVLREKIIRQYNLMPVLFYKKWDASRQTWKKDSETGFGFHSIYPTWLRVFFYTGPAQWRPYKGSRHTRYLGRPAPAGRHRCNQARHQAKYHHHFRRVPRSCHGR